MPASCFHEKIVEEETQSFDREIHVKSNGFFVVTFDEAEVNNFREDCDSGSIDDKVDQPGTGFYVFNIT